MGNLIKLQMYCILYFPKIWATLSNYRCIVYCIFQRYGQPYQITDVLYTVFSKYMGNLIRLQMYCILYFLEIWATLSNYRCIVYCIFQRYGQPYQITDVLYTVFSKYMGNLIRLQMYCILYFLEIWATLSNYRCIVYCIFQRYGQPYQITDVLYTVFSKDMGNLIKLQMYCILYFPNIWVTLSDYRCTVYCIFQRYGQPYQITDVLYTVFSRDMGNLIKLQMYCILYFPEPSGISLYNMGNLIKLQMYSITYFPKIWATLSNYICTVYCIFQIYG